MKVNIIATFGLLPILMGCLAKPSWHYDVEIDSAFTPDQIDLIYQALDNWQTVSQGQASFTVTRVTDNPCQHQNNHSFCFTSTTLDVVQSRCNKSGISGCTVYSTLHDSAVISIETEYNSSYLLQELQHETGHAMGLKHTGPGTIMCADASCAAKTVQCADVHQYEDIRHSFEMVCPSN